MASFCRIGSGDGRPEKKRLTNVGKYLLGDGPQPSNITLGVICESFGCLPSQALEEDWGVVRDIMEYRLLLSAREQHNQDASKMQPSQIELWKEMVEAVEDEDG